MLIRTVAAACMAVASWTSPGLSLGQEPWSPANSSNDLQRTQLELPDSAIERLLQDASSAFIAQSVLDPLIENGGGGACPSAACVNALQVLRVMAGLDPIANPNQAAIAAFQAHPDLLKGRLSNEQVEQLLRFHQAKNMASQSFRVEVVSAPNSGYRTHKATWSEAQGPDLQLARRQLKILSYTVIEPTGVVAGRHFVLLKKVANNEIEVLDPLSPTKPRRYALDFRKGENGPKARILLQNPPNIPRRHEQTFEVNTLFSVSFVSSALSPGGQPTVDAMKKVIDDTANDLRKSNQLTNPLAWRQQTAKSGLPSLDLPLDRGGNGWPAVKMIEVFRHAGRHDLNLRDVVGGAHARALAQTRTPEIDAVVQTIAAGQGYMAIAITEPDAGSDISAIKSKAEKVEGGYILSGSKLYNARLKQASHIILFVQSASGSNGKLTAFLVPIHAEGMKIETLEAHGLTGNSFGGMTFQNLKVTDKQMVGKDGEAMKLFFNHFLYWRLMQTAAAIGTGEQALDQMASRIKSRQAFGGPIGRFTHLQQPIGQHKTELLMAFALLKDAAERIDRGDYGAETRGIICGLKAEGVETSIRAVDAAMRAFGGEGYSTKVDLGQRLRDLHGLRIADGTTDVMRMEVVRNLFGREFWDMAIESKQKAPNDR